MAIWYWLLAALVAVWVAYDASKRKAMFIGWALGVLLLTPIILPIYLAARPLKAGETREGGRGWNILKNFALTWTVLMVMMTAVSLSATVNMPATTSGAASLGRGIALAVALAGFGGAWLFPMIGALVLGFFLRKSHVVERGPTGRLAHDSGGIEPAG